MTGTITEIKSGIDGLNVSITETKEEISGVKENNLVYDVSYQKNDDGTTTLTAVVYKNGKVATEEYPENCFFWHKRTETEEKFLGYGYTITVKNSEYAYGGVVVGWFETQGNAKVATAQGTLKIGDAILCVGTN